MGAPPSRVKCAAEAWTENDGAGNSNDPPMVCTTWSGEIMKAIPSDGKKFPALPCSQPAVGAHAPVSDDGVDETSDANAVEKVADDPVRPIMEPDVDRRTGVPRRRTGRSRRPKRPRR